MQFPIISLGSSTTVDIRSGQLCLLKISSGLERLNLRRSSFRLNGYVCNHLFPALVVPSLAP